MGSSAFPTVGADLARRRVKKKILLLGDGAVGKTSLIRKFVTDKFNDDYIMTIGTKITKKDIELSSNGDTFDLSLMIWDVLGQKGYSGTQTASYQGAEGVILVSDITRKETLESLDEYWIPSLEKVVGGVPMVYVANKCDLEDERQFSEGELSDKAGGRGAPYYLSSAKTGEQVEDLFKEIGLQLLDVIDKVKPSTLVSGEGEEKGKQQKVKLSSIEPKDLVEACDHIMNDFCSGHGDSETAMAMIRQQFKKAGVDIEDPDKKAILNALKSLEDIERGYMSEHDAKMAHTNRRLLIEKVK